MTHSSAALVRRLIARAIIGRHEVLPHAIGAVTLRAHQHAAGSRLLSLLEQHGGAMLAEAVGLGKTYTSLAVAAQLGEPLTIVTPSALREMWNASLARCGLNAPIITHEALSRGANFTSGTGLVIIDEAHRARSPHTRRYASIAELCKRARVLLVTATPVQNRRADLAAQLALFLGRRAWEMREDELAAHVVRGGSAAPSGLPMLSGPHRIDLATLDDCLDHLVALPPPIPADGESIVAALLAYGLIHQWSSSRAALAAALNRRRARGLALLAALDTGRRPTRAELSAWTHTGDALQLAFPELVTAESPIGDLDAPALSLAVDRHNAAVDALVRHLKSTPDPDDERAAALRRIRAQHPGERIIAFCHYTETVNALRAKLARDPGVAALTANGGRVAGGRISRADVLAQFTPSIASDTSARDARAGIDRAAPVRAAERIDLLLTTDLLSEGLNLHEASVVVHLDLPWNPARLDQRVGRARRIGSRFETVSVYTIAPPASAEKLIRIEQRLRDKLNIAQRTVGVAGRILPSPVGVDRHESGLAERAGAIDETLRAWLSATDGDAATSPSHGSVFRKDGRPITAAVAAPHAGFIALVHDRDGRRLVADTGHGISVATDDLLCALELSRGDERTPVAEDADAAVARVAAWLDARRGAATIDLGAAAAARSRRTTLLRVSQALERTPRHRRAQLAPLADAARAVAITPLAEGAERILERLAAANLPDEAWLRSVAAFAALNARPARNPTLAGNQMPAPTERPTIEYVILFQETSGLERTSDETDRDKFRVIPLRSIPQADPRCNTQTSATPD